jgi:hypothetical protein
MGKDHTIFAKTEGWVHFTSEKRSYLSHRGQTKRLSTRQFINVVDYNPAPPPTPEVLEQTKNDFDTKVTAVVREKYANGIPYKNVLR